MLDYQNVDQKTLSKLDTIIRIQLFTELILMMVFSFMVVVKMPYIMSYMTSTTNGYVNLISEGGKLIFLIISVGWYYQRLINKNIWPIFWTMFVVDLIGEAFILIDPVSCIIISTIVDITLFQLYCIIKNKMDNEILNCYTPDKRTLLYQIRQIYSLIGGVLGSIGAIIWPLNFNKEWPIELFFLLIIGTIIGYIPLIIKVYVLQQGQKLIHQKEELITEEDKESSPTLKNLLWL